MLEYSLMQNGNEIHEGTIGNQFKFMELLDALRNVYERFPNQYPTVYKYFPTSNDGEIPLERVEQFLGEFKEIGNEKVLGNELIWENRNDRKFLLSTGFEFTQLTNSLYEVINEDGFNLIMEKSAFDEESNIENKSAFYIPYKQKGSNWNFFSKMNLQNPVIVFQSKSFVIRSLGKMQLYIDNEDGKKKFLFYSCNTDFGIVEHVKFGQGEIIFKNFNYIYSGLLNAVTEAFKEDCSIKWG